MILIAGGTGFVGQEVVRTALGLGLRVRLLVRNPHRAGRFTTDSRVELVKGDALKPETLPEAMKGVKAVINLIGIIKETSKVTFEEAHTEATRNLLEAAKAAGATRWIQMSAIGTRAEAISRYHQTKWQAEELVRTSGLDWTILRPSLIYGYDERDRLLNMLKLVLTWPPLWSFPLLDGGEHRVQPVSVHEVAHCFVFAVVKTAAIGQNYDLVGPTAITWRAMAAKVATALGRKTVYEEIPILLIERVVLWLGIAALPILLLVAMHREQLSLAAVEICLGLWAVAAIAAGSWRQLILFNLPAGPLLLAGHVLQKITPRSLHFSEQLKMAVEDNVGNPLPAAEAFDYIPESFDEGLSRIIRS